MTAPATAIGAARTHAEAAYRYDVDPGLGSTLSSCSGPSASFVQDVVTVGSEVNCSPEAVITSTVVLA